MRKTTASWWEERGRNATMLLKHSRRSVTLRYLDPRLMRQEQVADVLPRPDAMVKGLRRVAEGSVSP